MCVSIYLRYIVIILILIATLDCVVRTHYYKYVHPKECCITDSEIHKILLKDNNKEKEIDFVYPYGSTLNVSRPSVVAFTSGITTFPLDRPLGALYYHQKSGKLFKINYIKQFHLQIKRDFYHSVFICYLMIKKP